MVDASNDLASQKACLWCYKQKQRARRYDHEEYQKLTKLPRKQKKSHGAINRRSKTTPKDLKLNPSVPNPRFLYSTAEGKRRAWKEAIEERIQRCRDREIRAHSYNALCTIQEAEDEQDKSATGTNLFYNVHICAHAYQKARPTGSGPRNEAIYRLIKIWGFETLQHPDVAELESKLKNLGLF
ncbi:hypothetical protein MY11210_000886 [Beauveria gryllotalpidicola]